MEYYVANGVVVDDRTCGEKVYEFKPFVQSLRVTEFAGDSKKVIFTTKIGKLTRESTAKLFALVDQKDVGFLVESTLWAQWQMMKRYYERPYLNAYFVPGEGLTITIPE